jgi:hypothetical protein
MNEAGARFGPEHKAELLRTLPTEVIETYVGDRIEVTTSVYFLIRSVTASGKGEADLHWQVLVKSHPLDGLDATYRLQFEPFDGRLVAISLMFLDPAVRAAPLLRAINHW